MRSGRLVAGTSGTGAPKLSRILRDHTTQAHRNAEAAMPPDLVRCGAWKYLAVLNGLLVFHKAVAEFSGETIASELGPDIALLSRVQELRADIRLMLPRLSQSDRAKASRPGRDWPALAAEQLSGGSEERVGAAYVAAGSVLGGRVIAANLDAAGCDYPRSFFASTELEPGLHWHRFKAALDVFGESGVDSGRVVAGALAAFGLVGDILNPPIPNPERPDERRWYHAKRQGRGHFWGP